MSATSVSTEQEPLTQLTRAAVGVLMAKTTTPATPSRKALRGTLNETNGRREQCEYPPASVRRRKPPAGADGHRRPCQQLREDAGEAARRLR